MNTVCAAGTGSFLEEQARKLVVPISEYSSRAEGACAPLASDRCTVFMERDINQLMNNGYSVKATSPGNASLLYCISSKEKKLYGNNWLNRWRRFPE